MYVVVFAVELDEFRAEVLAYVTHDCLHVVKHVRVEYPATIFRYEDQMRLQIENACAAMS